MWKLSALACATALALGLGGCSADGGAGSLLSNSYITPAAGSPTALITFAGESNDPELSGYQIIQSPGPWTPSARHILILSGPTGWAEIPPGQSYNTINQSQAEADRTIPFEADKPVYFTGVLHDGPYQTYTCSIGVSFVPVAGRSYTVTFIGRDYACSAAVVDRDSGATPSTMRLYEPVRR